MRGKLILRAIFSTRKSQPGIHRSGLETAHWRSDRSVSLTWDR